MKATEFSELFDDVCDYLRYVAAQSGVPELFLGMSAGGESKFFANGQSSDDRVEPQVLDTAFDISCVFKPLVSAVALEMHTAGELDLNATIAHYLPELAKSRKGEFIRVRDVMCHTMGYRGFFVFPVLGVMKDQESQFSRIRRAQQIFWPGTVFSFDNSSTALLGEILRRVSGISVPMLADKMILAPLGLSKIAGAGDGGGRTNAGRSRSSGGFRLTIPELLKVVEVLMGSQSSALRLSAESARALLSPQVQIPRSEYSSAAALLPNAYSQGLMLFRHGFAGHDGMNATQTLGFRFNCEKQLAIVLGINRKAQELRRVVLGELLRIVRGEVHQRAAPTSDIGMLEPDEIAGYYVGNHAWDVEVKLASGQLTIVGLRSDKPVFQLRAKLDFDGKLHFFRGAPGFEPSFFRYERTGEPCMVLGLSALKKVPTVRSSEYLASDSVN